MPRKEHHLIPNHNGGWDVKRNGADRASVHADTKAEAEKAGREIIRNQGTEFVIHDSKGKNKNSDSHGNDPNPPKDQR